MFAAGTLTSEGKLWSSESGAALCRRLSGAVCGTERIDRNSPVSGQPVRVCTPERSPREALSGPWWSASLFLAVHHLRLMAVGPDGGRGQGAGPRVPKTIVGHDHSRVSCPVDFHQGATPITTAPRSRGRRHWHPWDSLLLLSSL